MNRFRMNGRRLRDDWFIFEFDHDHRECGSRNTCEPVSEEIHELCAGNSCAYSDGPCEFHPAGCDCSDGACQEL